MSERPQRNLAMEIVRVTEAAAMAAARFMGTGDHAAADLAAREAMHLILDTVDMDGVVVVEIGQQEEGEPDKLYVGERIGTGRPPAVDVAVKPIEGTDLLAQGRGNAVSLAVLAERWSIWNPGPAWHLNKLVVGKAAREAIDITLEPVENLHRIAEALGRPVSSLVVFTLDRPYQQPLIESLRAAGARVMRCRAGDVTGAILAVTPGSGVDVYMGVGSARSGVMAAVAVKTLGGAMQAMRAPQSEEERRRVEICGACMDEVLTENDLVASDDAFLAATGITDGSWLQGIHHLPGGELTTHSVVMRAKSGTVRHIQTTLQLERLMQFSQIDYGR